MPGRNPTSMAISPGSPKDQDRSAESRRWSGRIFDGSARAGEPRSFAPRMASSWLTLDLNETALAYTVTAELPGIDEKDVEVTLQDNTLIIRGEKRDEPGGEESDRVYMERSYGRFERTVLFDMEVDADKVQASARNGVLTVTLPKNPQARAKTRRIEVRRRDS
jgi:HSP20 family protein